MAAKQSELSKLLKKTERKLEKHARDPLIGIIKIIVGG